MNSLTKFAIMQFQCIRLLNIDTCGGTMAFAGEDIPSKLISKEALI